MPIVHVRALSPEDPRAVPRLLSALADGVSEACGCPPRDVWSTFTPVGAMAVGPHLVSGPEGAIAFVEVLMRDRNPDLVASTLARTTELVSDALSIPREDVWVRFAPVRPGEVHAGGKTLRW